MSRSDFDFLRLGMSYQEVIARVGEADLAEGTQPLADKPHAVYASTPSKMMLVVIRE